MCLKERLDRRRAIQEWYETRYLNEGTAVLLQHLAGALRSLQVEQRPPRDEERAQIIRAGARVNELLQSNTLERLLLLAITHAKCPTEDDTVIAVGLFSELVPAVNKLQRTLVTKQPRRKVDVLTMHDDPDLRELCEFFRERNEWYQDRLKARSLTVA
jgi:hypothetical protein